MTNSTIQQQVLARAIKDASFRQELLRNPKAVLAREFNFHVSDNMTIRVLEDSATLHTIVLPAQEAVTQELSDVELELVAGGMPPATALKLSCEMQCRGQ
ncbi:MAG TPA: NHLP leader peptide family RiPP precursor [Ktedonobacterales bacterium]|jgi:hypothetical protein